MVVQGGDSRNGRYLVQCNISNNTCPSSLNQEFVAFSAIPGLNSDWLCMEISRAGAGLIPSHLPPQSWKKSTSTKTKNRPSPQLRMGHCRDSKSPLHCIFPYFWLIHSTAAPLLLNTLKNLFLCLAVFGQIHTPTQSNRKYLIRPRIERIQNTMENTKMRRLSIESRVRNQTLWRPREL